MFSNHDNNPKFKTMKTTTSLKRFLQLLAVIVSVNLYAQSNDTIILTNGTVIPCTIKAISPSGTVTFQYAGLDGSLISSMKPKDQILEIRTTSGEFSMEEGQKLLIHNYSAGDYLIKAKKTLLVGSGLMLAGSVTAVIGGTVKKDGELAVPGLAYVGGGLGIIGFFVTMAGYVPIGKAGEIFNEKAIGHVKVKSEGNTLGIVYKF